ncbi:MAG: DUF4292 domain-containing protein [Bacteroides sp.]|nr:DUF4292 domain-containing protein [Bacteroides sp.]
MTPHRTHTSARALRTVCLTLLALLSLGACHTTRKAESSLPATEAAVPCLSAKLLLSVPHQEAVLSVNGTMKLKSGELLQLSFLMPILRSEVARMEITPEGILLIDRMNRRYARTTHEEMKRLAPQSADFARLQELILAASRPNGNRIITGSDIGLPNLQKGQIELSGFSEDTQPPSPTQLSDKYKEVEPAAMLEMLLSL